MWKSIENKNVSRICREKYFNGCMRGHNIYLAYYTSKKLNTLQEQFSNWVWDIIYKPMSLWTLFQRSASQGNQKGETPSSHASVEKNTSVSTNSNPQTHFLSSLPVTSGTNNTILSNSSWYFHYSDWPIVDIPYIFVGWNKWVMMILSIFQCKTYDFLHLLLNNLRLFN